MPNKPKDLEISVTSFRNPSMEPHSACAEVTSLTQLLLFELSSMSYMTRDDLSEY
jgi:hypothetical protein